MRSGKARLPNLFIVGANARSVAEQIGAGEARFIEWVLLHEQTHVAGTTVIVVTHNREISRVAHRVIELSSGRVVSDEEPAGGPAEISTLHW